MKKIALTQRLYEVIDYVEYRETLDINYAKLISTAGFLPIILPYEVDFNEYFNKLDIDGIVLTGGNNLNSLNSSALSFMRDQYEFKLLDFALKRDIPVLGICRGMQVIAAYFNSQLAKVSNQVNVRHTLRVNEDSKYVDYLMKLNDVNSFHNFGIESLCSDLIVSATNEKGMIKALEHKKKRIFAQMWHSEREVPFKKEEIALIQNFFGQGS